MGNSAADDNINKRVQKLVTFSPQLYRLAELKAHHLGLSFTEYLRHLLANAVEESGVIPMVDEETEYRIGESLAAYSRGEYVEVDPVDKRALNKILGIE